MKIKKESSEVFYIQGDITEFNKKLISDLILKCKKSSQSKSRYCMHSNTKSKVQEMIICHKKNYYVRPHKHIDKEESIFVIKGLAKAIFFDDGGKVKKIIRLGDIGTKRPFYYKLNKNLFHTLLIESNFFVFHEVSKGPFKKNKTIFPRWAPIKQDKIFKKFLNSQILKYEKNIQNKKKLPIV